ncbi:MAG: hypothetical protein ABI759_18370 [Candidatus Solibacter sp.]
MTQAERDRLVALSDGRGHSQETAAQGDQAVSPELRGPNPHRKQPPLEQLATNIHSEPLLQGLDTTYGAFDELL